eukprot:gene6189-12539_t
MTYFARKAIAYCIIANLIISNVMACSKCSFRRVSLPIRSSHGNLVKFPTYIADYRLNMNNPTSPNPNEDEKLKTSEESKLKDVMLDSIRWYKSTLSPLMPPNCRFLPTCSSYGIQAIQEFGPWKGGILTAWRIMRCTPIGGFGYDPPRWPPPGYFAGSNGKM